MKCEMKAKYGPAICPGCPHYQNGECRRPSDDETLERLKEMFGMK